MVRQRGGEQDRVTPLMRNESKSNMPLLKSDTKSKLNYSTLRAIVFFFCVLSASAAIPKTAIVMISFSTMCMFSLIFITYSFNEKMASFACLGTFGILVWYVILMVTNRSSLSKLPATWNTYNGIIAGLIALHFLFIAVGKAFYTFTWVTMAALAAMMTMQHVTLNNFKTNG